MQVSIHYVGKYYNGRQFDDSRQRDSKPDTFVLGAGKVIPGLDAALVGMREGGQRRITIPAPLAWGEPGFSPIPPNQGLVFLVDLEKVSPAS
jgi:peptidylprolyl isomerase